jgi:hypothetical protein
LRLGQRRERTWQRGAKGPGNEVGTAEESGGQASREEKESQPEELGTTAGLAGETGRRKTQRNGGGDDRKRRG